MKTVAIMTKQVYTIDQEQTVKECASILRERHVNGLVVVNSRAVVGVITKADLFKSFLLNGLILLDGGSVAGVLPKAALAETVNPSNSSDCGPHMPTFDCIEERAHQLDDVKVRTLMGTPAITVSSDTPIVQAGSLMVFKGIKQLPVVDNGRLTGIVTLTDIINCIMDKNSPCRK